MDDNHQKLLDRLRRALEVGGTGTNPWHLPEGAQKLLCDVEAALKDKPTTVTIAHNNNAIERAARRLWDIDEKMSCDHYDGWPPLLPKKWEDAHELDRDEYLMKAQEMLEAAFAADNDTNDTAGNAGQKKD